MLFVACLKQVVSRDSTLRVNAGGTWINERDVAWAMGESDGFALEAALRLREQHGGEVVAISVGPDRVSSVLRDALARGADRAIHVVEESGVATTDPRVTSAALAHGLANERPDLILTGLQSDDVGLAQVGGRLAESLSMPHATLVTAIEIGDGRVRVKRELEAGWSQWLAMPLPAVLTIQSGINALRFATLRGIMAAKKKAIDIVAAPVNAAVTQRVVAVSVPVRHKQTRTFGGTPAEAAVELAKALRQAH